MRSQRFDILLMISAGTTGHTAQGSQTDNWMKAFTDPQAAVAKALGEQPQDVGLLAIKERHELFMKAVGVNPNPSITKATTNKWQDFTNLSDRALITEYEKVASGAKHALFGPDEHGKAIIAEYKKRFPDHEGERNVEVLGAALTNTSGIIPKLIVEKATGSKLSGEVDPTDWAADRLSLIGKEGFKTKTPKAKGADSKEAKLNQSADLTLENSATTSKIEHKLAAAEGVSASHKQLPLDDAIKFPTNYKFYPEVVEWQSPAGTQQIYKIYQRSDIDWNMVRENPKGNFRFIGKTNKEAAIAGIAPELPNGSSIQLHHIGQNAKGPLVEVSSEIHNPQNKQAFKILHNQFGVNKGHSEFPVDHGNKWQSDVKNYWKWRVNNDK